MVATDNFEMSTYPLSRDYSASELRGYIQQDAHLVSFTVKIFMFAVGILKLGILKHTTCGISTHINLVCFRIPSIATGYDRVNTLTRSLTSALSPHVHVSCPPVYSNVYSALSGPRFLGISALNTHFAILSSPGRTLSLFICN